MKQTLIRAGRILGRSLFPHRCCNCDQLYAPETGNARKKLDPSHQLSGFLCLDCIPLQDSINSPLCLICGRSFQTDHGVDHVCDRCESAAFGFEAARSALTYASAVRSIVHLYKYQGCTQLARPLGAILWQALLSHWQPNQFDLVIPVPLHRTRLRRRGYNQSALMLRHWPEFINACQGNAGGFRIYNDLMVRHRATRPQMGLDADGRKANMRNAFSIRVPSLIKAKRILIVDDVFTTGATANACANVLKSAGATSVRVLTLARAA